MNHHILMVVDCHGMHTKKKHRHDTALQHMTF